MLKKKKVILFSAAKYQNTKIQMKKKKLLNENKTLRVNTFISVF